MKRIAVFLNGQRGLMIIDALSVAGHEVSTIYAKSENYEKLAPTLDIHGIRAVPVEDLKSECFYQEFVSQGFELAITAGFNQLLPRRIFDECQFGGINLHGGPLPGYRGGSTLNWQIINGETEIGVSVIRLTDKVDGGRVLAEARWPIGRDDTISEVHALANEKFVTLTTSVVDQIEKGQVKARDQDETSAVYWHQRNDEDGYLDFSKMSAVQVHNMIRALTHPYPGAFAFNKGTKVRLLSSRLVGDTVRGTPGHVLWRQGTGPLVICRDTAIHVQEYRIDSPGQRMRLRQGDLLNATFIHKDN